jgi:hypothetical protein
MSCCSTNPKLFFLTNAATGLAHEIESAFLKLESSGKTVTKLSIRCRVTRVVKKLFAEIKPLKLIPFINLLHPKLLKFL